MPYLNYLHWYLVPQIDISWIDKQQGNFLYWEVLTTYAFLFRVFRVGWCIYLSIHLVSDNEVR